MFLSCDNAVGIRGEYIVVYEWEQKTFGCVYVNTIFVNSLIFFGKSLFQSHKLAKSDQYISLFAPAIRKLVSQILYYFPSL